MKIKSWCQIFFFFDYQNTTKQQAHHNKAVIKRGASANIFCTQRRSHSEKPTMVNEKNMIQAFSVK